MLKSVTGVIARAVGKLETGAAKISKTKITASLGTPSSMNRLVGRDNSSGSHGGIHERRPALRSAAQDCATPGASHFPYPQDFGGAQILGGTRLPETQSPETPELKLQFSGKDSNSVEELLCELAKLQPDSQRRISVEGLDNLDDAQLERLFESTISALNPADGQISVTFRHARGSKEGNPHPRNVIGVLSCTPAGVGIHSRMTACTVSIATEGKPDKRVEYSGEFEKMVGLADVPNFVEDDIFNSMKGRAPEKTIVNVNLTLTRTAS